VLPSLDDQVVSARGSRQYRAEGSDGQLLDLEAGDNAELTNSKLPDGLSCVSESSGAYGDLGLDDASVLM
jgi:hypothetical protein